ncbi:circadian clock protein KaiA [Leptolyngbya sp. FACHB-321]|uniref:circadian clock protein KaiA n=1 Tax=Leptolyngbya sp. FACHB-321 TaxID=2692807 RepID=UPI001F553702|nr:circadian clock protein KaiA [Leptolyngbya sp. FACHB-321]
MSRFQTVLNHPLPHSQRSKLSVGIFLAPESLAQAVLQRLDHDRYSVTMPKTSSDFFSVVEHEKQHLDCLILQGGSALPQLAKQLHGQATLLPAIIVSPDIALETLPTTSGTVKSDTTTADPAIPGTNAIQTADAANAIEASEDTSPVLNLAFVYHTAEVWITIAQCDAISDYIEQAIEQFLHLSPTCRLSNALSTVDLSTDITAQNFLMLQQRRLTEKLKERLGYLGVYYKRNPRNFFRYMALEQQQETLEQLRDHYREIILYYFSEDDTLNQRIDEFVNAAFFTDIATSQVVEIHMDLMDEFAKQLKLEGRSDDILLDYRLTLIDTIAHLCEMYRRSVPREN